MGHRRTLTLLAFVCGACSSPRPTSAPAGASAAGAGTSAAGGASGSGGSSSGSAASGGTQAGAAGSAGQAGGGAQAGTAGSGDLHGCPRDVAAEGALSPAWSSYAATPDAHPNVPNVSYAGYRHGEVPLPSPLGPLVDVTEHGAAPDDGLDDTSALRAALATVGDGGAVVYFPNGTYDVSGPLFVHTDHTVLRGESRDGTRLVFSESLLTSYGANTKPDTGQSRWSWSGGLIWFTPASKNTYRPDTSNLGATFDESWDVGAELGAVTSSALRGERTFQVQESSALVAGEYVFVQVDNAADLSLLEHLTGDGAWAEGYDWSEQNSARVLPGAYPAIVWPAQIESVEGTSVTLHQPLRFDLRPEWNPRLRAVGATIRESGLENLTIELQRDYAWSFEGNHNQEPGWNGPWFNLAVDCFLRGVTVIDADMGLGVSASKNVTLSDFRLESSNAERELYHHATTMRMFSSDVLFEKFTIDNQPFHGINVEGFSTGGVWSEGAMAHGTFDTHRNLPLDCVHTEIVINNDATRGGAPDAGPVMGARFANWNVEVTNGRNHMIGEADLMPQGALVGVRGADVNEPGNSACLIEGSGVTAPAPNPGNLYQAELALRLCGGI